MNLSYKTSYQRCSLRKLFLKNFPKLLGKHLCSPETCNFIKKETSTNMFSCKFYSFCTSSHSLILQKSFIYLFIYLFKPSFVRKINKNSQLCHLTILQIHFILYIVNAFYRSKHKHKKSCFVNEKVELYL